MNQFCEMKGIKREFSVARTLQQNGVAERKNRTLIEAVRTMLADLLLPTTFWAEAINNAFYVQNRVLITKPHNKTPYELLIGRSPNLDFMRSFGCPVTILNTLEHLGKFEGKADEGFLVGYSVNTHDDEDVGVEADLNNLETTMNVSPIHTIRIHRVHPKEQIIGDLNLATQTRRMINYYKEHGMVDVKSAFLYGTIKERRCTLCATYLVLRIPQFIDKVYKVEKALYGLHQAPRAWCMLMISSLGLQRSLMVESSSRLMKRDSNEVVGDLTFFLGLQVQQKEDGIFISQDKYMADILKKFDFVTVKTSSTPIETNKALIKDEEAKDMDIHLYISMIGSLMYLIASRPDIMFAVCACARFQAYLKVSPSSCIMKRIFRYLKGQPKLGLWYPRDSPFDLEAFYNSDYARASLDRKSIIGGCQLLSKRLISWQCKKQTIVANSTIEAEYVAAANCCGQVLWIPNQMLDYGFNFMNTKLYIDNESTISIVKNPVFHSKTKHIEIRHYFIRDSYEKKLIQVINIHIDHNVADFSQRAFDIGVYVEKENGNKAEVLCDGLRRTQYPQHTSTYAHISNEKPITVLSSSQLKKTYKPRKAKRTTKISQSSGPIYLVADETVYKEWEDRMERAATTASSLEAEQDNGNINRTQSMATLNEPFPKGTGSGSGPRFQVKPLAESGTRFLPFEDSNETKELMEYVQTLVDILERKRKKEMRHLKLEDSDGINTLPNIEIFEQLALMGNMRRASKGYIGVDIPLFPTMLVQGPILQGEGSTVLVESHHTPSVANEAAFTGVNVVHGGAATTISSIDVRQGGGNIPKSPTMSHHSPLLRDHTYGSDEGSLPLHELTVLYIKLSNKVESLETKLKQTKQIYGDAFTKLIKKVKKLEQTIETSQDRRRAKIVVSNNEENKEDPSKQGMKVTTADAKHNIASTFVSTASPQRHTYTTAETLMEIRKSAAKTKDAEWDDVLARVAADEDFVLQLQAGEKCSEEDLPMKLVELVNQRKKFFTQQRAEAKRNKPMTPAQQKDYMSNYIKNQEGSYSIKQLKSLSFELVKEIFETTMKRVRYPIIDREIFADMLKKFDRDDLVKLWDLVKERFSITEPIDDKEKELWVELKRLFKPDNDDILWKL
ncbi:putative ribonuclease H-like domain-containing protein [Tanacetum coccineum]